MEPDPIYEWDYAILGPGALGSIISAQLRRAGHSVAIIARGRRAEHIRSKGIRLSGLADFSISANVIEDTRALTSCRTLIIATKAIDTLRTLASLRHIRFETALSLQNGVRKSDDLKRTFGAERILGAVADFSGEMLAHGDVRFTRNEGLFIGEIDGGFSPRLDRLVRDLNGAGIATRSVDNIVQREWSKFAGWVGMFAASVLVRQQTWKFLRNRDCAAAIVRIVREMGTLANAQGIALNDQAVLPVGTICQSSEAEAASILETIGDRFYRLAPQHKVSALQDIEAGRTLELEETIGYALQSGNAVGVEMPTLATIFPFLEAANVMAAG